jgi:hypothetical protein
VKAWQGLVPGLRDVKTSVGAAVHVFAALAERLMRKRNTLFNRWCLEGERRFFG